MARVHAQVDPNAWRKAKQFIAVLKARGLRIHSAYLYGSHAKGTPRAWSDIDVAVVARNLSQDWGENFLTLAPIAHEIDSRIEAVGYVPKNFRDESPLVWEIKTTGIPLTRDGAKRKRSARKRTKRV